jgi:hypothetical protein
MTLEAPLRGAGTRPLHAVRMAVGIVAFLVFLVTLGVHIAAVAGTDVETAWPDVWLLHYGVFPIFLIAMLFATRAGGARRRTFLEVVYHMPVYARLLAGAAFIYALANFVLIVPGTGFGNSVVKDGQYSFVDHGVVRVVTEEQFHAMRALKIRGYSGHWLFLYFVSAIYLLTGRTKPVAVRPAPIAGT